ncbi:MAG: hypothetical protein KAR21_17240 [Spirochaetales bacterium]|nr:hypothetical protein [Spirochaetales bacterium]
MKRFYLYDQKMSKFTIKELLVLSVDWTVKISKFYADFREITDDVSYRKLLTTMIDQEGQYTEYYEENLRKLDLKSDFGPEFNEILDFNGGSESIPSVSGMAKIDFLRNAVRYQGISIATCEFLGSLCKTDSGRQIFKTLSDEERRHMLIFKDHLELEELF